MTNLKKMSKEVLDFIILDL